jgi:hypothetical protein
MELADAIADRLPIHKAADTHFSWTILPPDQTPTRPGGQDAAEGSAFPKMTVGARGARSAVTGTDGPWGGMTVLARVLYLVLESEHLASADCAAPRPHPSSV